MVSRFLFLFYFIKIEDIADLCVNRTKLVENMMEEGEEYCWSHRDGVQIEGLVLKMGV